MRIAVAGATGNIGARTVAALERDGHETVGISRSLGVDLLTGAGLDDALAGVDAVVDATSTAAQDEAEVVRFFADGSRNLLAAEERAGVRHHVLLSIVGLAEPTRNPHYAGKLAQERTVESGSVPWTIVRAIQFHDFAATVASWVERDGVAPIAPLLVQPIAPDDVATVLAEVAAGPAQRARIDIAGPDTQALVDMARRTYAARGEQIQLIPTWDGPSGTAMAGNVLLPGPDARIMPTSFDEWLAAGAR